MSQRDAGSARGSLFREQSPEGRRATRFERWLTRFWLTGRAGTPASNDPAGEHVNWERSQRTVWVATHSTEFLGMVELYGGRFVANDTAHGTYRTYSTLAAAMHALEAPVLAR
jgi:hypothetical protein